MSYISGGESKLIQIVQVETVTLPSLMIDHLGIYHQGLFLSGYCDGPLVLINY